MGRKDLRPLPMQPRANPHARHGSATERPDGATLSTTGYAVLAKYRWRTPPEVYAKLDAEFSFDLDACADESNHLAPRWFSEADDCMLQDWRYGWRHRGGDGLIVYRPETPFGGRPDGPRVVWDWNPYP